MNSTYSITDAQRRLPGLVRESAEGGAVAITRHDKTVAYVISRERMEAIVETMEILANPKAMATLRAFEAGKARFRPVEVLDREG